MQNSKAEPTEPADVANDRSSRFVWSSSDVIIIKAGDETPAADAKHHKPATHDAPAQSKDDTNIDDQGKKQKP